MSDSEKRKERRIFRSLLGLSLGWFALAGGIGTFVLLRWIGLAQVVADSTAPLGVAGQAVLGVTAVFANFALLVVTVEGYYQSREIL